MRRRVVTAIGSAIAVEPVDEYATLVAELLTWDALEGATQLTQLQKDAAKRAFSLLRDAQPALNAKNSQLAWWLRTASLAILADVPQDGRKLLEFASLKVECQPGDDWLEFTRQCVWTSWLGLLRHRSTEDVHQSRLALAELRSKQKTYEGAFLETLDEPTAARQAALELMGFYSLGTAAERLSEYLEKGTADGAGDINAQLDMYFDRVMGVLDKAGNVSNIDIIFLLRPTAHCLAYGSLRAATRGANFLTRQFAESLISRTARPLFQLLPPQREALRGQGLASNAHRSVVVNFPTSSGKTLLAQFGILQSLNDLGAERGWVAYVAPTRALVNQVTSRLRRDFAPLNKRVERLSPALEFDTIELSALSPKNPEIDGPPVDVLVCTPEKLDLLIRREELSSQLGRLALVVVDEAHGLGAKGDRAIKLELLLSIVNREHVSARFLLLTPFISNAKQVAQWLDNQSFKDYSIEAEWVPNDRIIGIVTPPEKSEFKRGEPASFLNFEPVATRKATLHLDEVLKLEGVDPELKLTVAKLSSNAGNLSTAAAQVLSNRGPTVILCRTVSQTWTCAGELAKVSEPFVEHKDICGAVARFATYELGISSPLGDLLERGIGVHHAGLPEEVAQAIEYLFENQALSALCATTTLAQGVNFPIANLVISSIFPPTRDGQPMSYADFWNIAGRVGRVDQEAIGVVALAAKDAESKQKCEQFLDRSMVDLVSTLLSMVDDLNALAADKGLEALVWKKEWSNFSQFIAHTLRQVGASKFADQVELVLRGTFGYQSIREKSIPLANELLRQTRRYAEQMAQQMGVVKLVDSTGFSFESVRGALARLSEVGDLPDLVNPTALFSGESKTLKDVMGVLLTIPEVKSELVDGGGGYGSRIADMLSDWVHGESLEVLSARYFSTDAEDEDAMAKCVRSFKRLSMTAAWGLSSVLAMKVGEDIEDLPDELRQSVVNIPSMVLYGVWDSKQIALRSAGVPRNAAIALAKHMTSAATPFATRKSLKDGGERLWSSALGSQRGADYFRVWQMLEGV
jgi:replicative superfamily II helicase